MTKPNPGTPEAIVLGCICSVLDNNHGEGMMIDGVQYFWYTEGCPVHNGEKDDSEQKRGTDPA